MSESESLNVAFRIQHIEILLLNKILKCVPSKARTNARKKFFRSLSIEDENLVKEQQELKGLLKDYQ